MSVRLTATAAVSLLVAPLFLAIACPRPALADDPEDRAAAPAEVEEAPEEIGEESAESEETESEEAGAETAQADRASAADEADASDDAEEVAQPEDAETEATDPEAADPEDGDPEEAARMPAPRERIAPLDPDTPLEFTFQGAEWADVLHHFAQWAGLTLDMTDEPPGTFSYYDTRRHTPTEALDILNGYLLPRGYVLIRRDQFLVVLETDNEMLSNLVPTIDVAELGERGDNELVRVVLPLEDIDPETAAEEVEQVLGPHGSVAALNTSQAIVVKGFGSNLRDVLAMLEGAVPPVTDDKLDFRAFPLQHLPAADAEKQIRALFGLESGARNVSGARSSVERARARSRGRRRGGDDDDDRSREPVPLMVQVAANMQVSSLPRTNSLLVTATPAGLALVEEILESIDVAQDDAAADVLDSSTPVLRVYSLEDANEEEVAKTLDVIMPGVVVNEDRRQDTVHILATPKEHEEVEELIRTLDSGGESSRRTVEVIQLRRFDPTAMSRLLDGMFENERRDDRPIIQAEPHTRTLVVRGTASQVEQIRGALVAYGEDGGRGTGGGGGSGFRSITVRGSGAEQVARAAEQILSHDRRLGERIRVVVPGERDAKDVREVRDRSDRREQQTRRDRDRAENAAGDEAQFVRAVSLETDDDDRASDRQQSAGAEPRDPPSIREADGEEDGDDDRSARVNVEVRGDRLFLYSEDEQALDQVEETIRDLVRDMPERTSWTVFYLRAAEAEEMASRLFELLPDQPVASPSDTSLDASFGPAAEPLRIIPDSRTNALFVSGPAEQIDQIEEFLEFLDTSELPKSFRSRVPRPIQVQYADVNEVADMIRELYKDYLTDPAAQRRENDRRNRGRDGDRGNRGGSSGGGSDGDSPGIRLTLAVDEQTSELLVSCDEALFREISELVEAREQAARDTEQTIQLLPVRGSTPAELPEILEGMSSKISATTIESEESQSSNNDRSRRRSRWRRN